MEVRFPVEELLLVMPEIIICGFGLLTLLLEAFTRQKSRSFLGILTLVGAVLALIFLLKISGLWCDIFFGLYTVDSLGSFTKGLSLVVLILITIISLGYLEREQAISGEYYSLLLFATLGMMIMVSSNNLLTIFIGLEVMSISVYILCGLFRENAKSAEASLKYFLLGAFSSAFFVYGVALLYGSTGSLDIAGYADFVSKGNYSTVLMLGVALLIVGFAFKIALVPFHMWTPDVYEGAPTSITAFMAAGVKSAAFVTFLRVFYKAFLPLIEEWGDILWLIAAFTMSYANITALVQDNVKRMLAYSSIAHAGYVLIAFVTGQKTLSSSIVYYLMAYTFMNIGAFACVILLGRKGEENLDINSYAGLSGRHPFVALCLTIFLLSLTGIPPLAGFMAKFYVFSAAIKAGYVWLAIIGVLNSVVAAYYYLRVIMYMYFKEPVKDIGEIDLSSPYILVSLICIFFLIYMGIFPRMFMIMAQKAVSTLI
ncbi:MAG: NADH-quinone oxidoreductase subunit N [Desulfobacterota bacterium]|nr:NADH-quinone oxidoreductase subunit N [Thermodesulfobacteriota bacterium]MDW8001858.1 NADH-quinone oxidoreductase subunit N [Deltaproteobacteria bacterium]